MTSFGLRRQYSYLDDHIIKNPCSPGFKPVTVLSSERKCQGNLLSQLSPKYTNMIVSLHSAIKILIKLFAIYRTLKVTQLFIMQHLGECSTGVTQ